MANKTEGREKMKKSKIKDNVKDEDKKKNTWVGDKNKRNKLREFLRPNKWKIISSILISVIIIVALFISIYSPNHLLSFIKVEKVGDTGAPRLNLPITISLIIIAMPLTISLVLINQLESFINSPISLYIILLILFLLQIGYLYLLSCIVIYLITKLKENVKKNKRLIGEVVVLVTLVLSIGTVNALSSMINVNVIETKKLDLTFIPIDYPANFNTNVEEFAIFFNKTYPLSDDGLIVHFGNTYSTTEEEKSDSNKLLFNIARKFSISFGARIRTVGILPTDWFGDYQNKSNQKGYALLPPHGMTFWRSVLVEAVGMRQIAAHEIGHTLGLCDEYNGAIWSEQEEALFFSCPNGDADNNNELDTNCESAGGCPTSTIGKLVPWINSSDFVNMTNLMGNDNSDDTWISKDTYIHLLNKFQESPPIVQKAILVSGVINKTGGSIQLFTSYIIEDAETTQPQENSTGNYSVQILNNSESIASQINFTPIFLEIGFNGSTTETNISYFIAVMNFTENDTTIRALENNVVKAEVNRSPNTPSIKFITNLSNKIFSDELFNVTWNVSDADNNSMVYAILFSTDNGSNYTTLEIDFNETTLIINSSNLQDCEECKIKVLVSDGINTNSSQSGIFKIRNNMTTINVASCQELNQPNKIYTLQNDVSSDGTCFTITANNITLDGQGHEVTYRISGNSSLSGVYINNVNQTTIKNLKIREGNASGGGGYAIYLDKANNALIDNNTLITNASTSDSILLISSSDNFITNNTINIFGNTSVGVDLYSLALNNIVKNNDINAFSYKGYGTSLNGNSVDNTLNNNDITTSGSEGHGIYLFSSNNTFYNNVIKTSGTYAMGIYIAASPTEGTAFFDSLINASHSSANDTQFGAGTSGAINFTNVTLANKKVGFSSSSTAKLNIYWYFDAEVKNSTGDPVANANVSGWDKNNILRFSVLTNANGNIARQTLIEYMHNYTAKIYYTNYTIDAVKDNNMDRKSINISTNIFKTFTLLPITTATLNASYITEDGEIDYVMFSSYVRYKSSSTNYAGYPYYIDRGYIEFNTSSIPNNANIVDVVLNISLNSLASSQNCDINQITNRPLTASNQTLYNDIADGTSYINNDDFCSTDYNTKLDLGISADNDLKNLISSDWFAVGIKTDPETPSKYARFYASESSSWPILIVKYI